jgi:RNA 2',3'-cyclic 3'-phosphodiesterase
MIRAFIAIKVPPEIQQAIKKHIRTNAGDIPQTLVRWVAPLNIHITIKFLGESSSEKLNILYKLMEAEISQKKSFAISLENVRVFPNYRKPRIIWIGLTPHDELLKINQQVELLASQAGYQRENRPYTPHLTIGRINQGIEPQDVDKIRKVIDQSKGLSFGTFKAVSLIIVKSDLQPTGPVYSDLVSIPFQS